MANSLTGNLGGLGDTIGDILGNGGSGSGSGIGGTIGDILGGGLGGIPSTADPDHLLGGLTMLDLLGINLSLLGNDLLGTGIALDGQSLTLPTGVDLGGILGTDQADVVNLGEATRIGSAVLGAGDDTFLAPVTSTVTGIIDAGDGNDTVTIGTGDATLRGGAGDDSLTALGTGDNVIDGGTGADTMSGGRGDDTYYVDNSGDRVIERPGEGNDTVYSSVSFNMSGQEIENLVLTGHAAINGTGNELANTITGNDAANRIDGGAGADHMAGGAGNDTYVVDNAGDVVTEAAGGGTDTVESSINYALGDNLENLTLTGSAALSGTGNALANHLVGNGAANVIDGKGGADVMEGGAGNDTYHVDNAGDRVIEAAHGGTDTVMSTLSFTATGQEIENVTLLGTADLNVTGNGLDNVLTGNAGDNRIIGGAGEDRMIGGAGNDIYYVDNVGDVIVEGANGGADQVVSTVSYTLGANVERLELSGAAALRATGNDIDNHLIGNDYANILDGKGGADLMEGGLGNDTYYVDNAGDRVIEKLHGGIDTVISTVDFSAKGQEIEIVELTGAANVNATGNSLDNTVTGNSGDNRLDGGTGADTMTGGAGNDTYVIDNAGDRMVERADGGTDTALSSVSYSLVSTYVENLTLTGSHALNGTGNSLANVLNGNNAANVLTGFGGDDHISGGGGNDTINGGVGKDSMTGGSGADRFLFATGDFGGKTQSAADVITDFSSTQRDKIDLSAVDADIHKSGHQHFTFVGDHAFTGAGQIRVEHDGSDLYLVGTTGTDLSGDFRIHLQNVHDITAADLII